jgi:hypothetical protein
MAIKPPTSSRDAFYDSREWHMGDTAQKRWVRVVAAHGHTVLPTYAMSDAAAATKAPILYAPDNRQLIAPDALVLHPKRSPSWHEVKAKAQPTWRRVDRCWEHGCDYSLFVEYFEVMLQTNAPVLLVVHENLVPSNPFADSPLVPGDVWLLISLIQIGSMGERRTTWPGGARRPWDRGRRGQGGILWPRTEMRPFTFAAPNFNVAY